MLVKLLNRLRNGQMIYRFDVCLKEVTYCTKILDVLWEEDYIRGYLKIDDGFIKVLLRYHEGSPICTRMTILSLPRDRLYLSRLDLGRIVDDFGTLILSTPKGIMSSKKAIRKGQGGEILAYIS